MSKTAVVDMPGALQGSTAAANAIYMMMVLSMHDCTIMV
jgi:hypothetical protein